MRNRPQSVESLEGNFAIKNLIVANVAVFLLSLILQNFFGSDILERYFAFSQANLFSGKIWTLFTYAFLHGNLFHLGVNMLILWFVCRGFELSWGKSKTFLVYFAAILGGAIFNLGVSFLGKEAILVGASAGVLGVLAAYFYSMPDENSRFAIFGIFPISIRPKFLLLIVAGCEFLGLLFVELAPYSNGGGIGYSAHLGGICFGLLMFLGLTDGFKNWKSKLFKTKNSSRNIAGEASDYKFKVDISDDDYWRNRTNEILDKVKREGFYSLTDEEKDFLNKAKDKL